MIDKLLDLCKIDDAVDHYIMMLWVSIALCVCILGMALTTKFTFFFLYGCFLVAVRVRLQQRVEKL